MLQRENTHNLYHIRYAIFLLVRLLQLETQGNGGNIE